MAILQNISNLTINTGWSDNGFLSMAQRDECVKFANQLVIENINALTFKIIIFAVAMLIAIGLTYFPKYKETGFKLLRIVSGGFALSFLIRIIFYGF